MEGRALTGVSRGVGNDAAHLRPQSAPPSQHHSLDFEYTQSCNFSDSFSKVPSLVEEESLASATNLSIDDLAPPGGWQVPPTLRDPRIHVTRQGLALSGVSPSFRRSLLACSPSFAASLLPVMTHLYQGRAIMPRNRCEIWPSPSLSSARRRLVEFVVVLLTAWMTIVSFRGRTGVGRSRRELMGRRGRWGGGACRFHLCSERWKVLSPTSPLHHPFTSPAHPRGEVHK